MTSIIDKFHEYGKRSDKNALERLMDSLDETELVNLVKQISCSSKFIEIWDYILMSFPDTFDSHKKRIVLVISLLKDFEERDVSQSHIDTIINRLDIHLWKFKSSDLAKICSLCLEQIQSKKTIKFVWKSLLPKVLDILVKREETFTYEELDFTGVEYKNDFINTVCMSSWSPSIVTSLTTIFIDIPLNKEEHLKVVTKLSSYIEKLTPQEIPAFVYQMLRLCKQQNGRFIFFKLQNYFGLRIYNNSNIGTEDSPDSMVFDLIETTNNTDTIDAESTVLYHIHTAASAGHGCVKEYLNSLKNIVKAPEFVLNPFQLMVLFTISTFCNYEKTVFEIIRSSITRTYSEELKKSHSAWFREMVTSGQKVEDVISQVLQFSLQDRDLVLTGLVKFAFVLLGVGSLLGRDIIAEKQWILGNTILLKIIKRKRSTALTIFQTLNEHIGSRQNVSQYIECFYILSRSIPLLMIENQSCVIQLINYLQQVSIPIANQLLDALIPLIKVSPTIRDHLIMYLRKGLHSRSIESRQMAVNGFLKLITNLKISNMAVLSQGSMGSFSSGHSVFTQFSLNKPTQSNCFGNFSNEALCFEILVVLKICFTQQAEVRAQLYDGLYEAVCLNPELGIPVLRVIWNHISEYIISDEDHLPPINFDKLVELKDAQVILIEPFGNIIQTFGLIVTKVLEIEDNKENDTVKKFLDTLDSISHRMSNCELVHLELDDGTNLLDILPESQKKMLILKQALLIYEALIGYKIYSWSKSSEKQGQSVNNLYQGYNRLVQFFKSRSNPKKADAKRKKADQDKTTQQSQQNKESQKLNKNIKLPDTLWNFQITRKALSLLNEPKLSWTTATEANVIKSKKEFHQHVMQVTITLIQNVKRRKDLETNIKKLYFEHITDISSIIFKRIINRLNEFIDFDRVTTVLAMECFNLILNLISTQYKSNVRLFLKQVVFDDKIDIELDPLKKMIETFENIFENEEYEQSDDVEIKKLSLIVVNTLQTLVNEIPTSSSATSVQLLEWLNHFAYNKPLTLKNSTAFINLFLDTHIKFKVSLTLLENISVSIGDTIGVITEEEHNKEDFQIINEASVNNILLSLCNSLKLILENIDALVLRLKSEYYVLNFPGEGNCATKIENLKLKEKGVCIQLCFVVTIMTNLSNLLIPAGNLSEAVFKSIILLFGSLSSLTKYFNARSSKTSLVFQSVRFERLVKLAGKQLTPTIYKFILYLEENQKEATQSTQHKKKSVDTNTLKTKVLRETRLIPKVIYEIEQFSKCVTQLSNKTKVDLSKYVGQGIVRDFRIMHLKEALDQGKDDDDQTYEELDTSLDTSRNEVTGGDTDPNAVDNEDEDEIPARKRQKI